MKSFLIVVFDGLQPGQIKSELMPNLAAFAAEGVRFRKHHPVFPSVTRLNAVSMLTGVYPGRHGLAGNTLVFRDYDPDRAVAALMPEIAQVAEKTGRILFVPNLADILGAHRREFVAVGVGSSGNAYLQNPNAATSGGAVIHPEFSLPRELSRELIGRFGPWPAMARPQSKRFAHAVQLMTEYVLPEREPAVTMLWSSEPDASQHAAGVGSDLAVTALANADRELGKLLTWLRETGRDAETDVLVLSDHGYSTITGAVDIEGELRAAGFAAARQPGGVVAAPNGGSVLFYTAPENPDTVDRLAQWIMRQPWCGSLFASEAGGDIPGTLPAEAVGIEGARAPDLAMSFSWDAGKNGAGYAGHVYSSSGEPGLGMHGSLSPYEMRSVMLARGPSFKSGVDVNTPTGHVDVTPTVLRVLGLDGSEGMDGRVLEEVVAGGPDPADSESTTQVLAAERRLDSGVYKQAVTIASVGSTRYVDSGTASFETT